MIARGSSRPICQIGVIMWHIAACPFTKQSVCAALQSEVQLPAAFIPTCMAHPDTYLNKVIVLIAGVA